MVVILIQIQASTQMFGKSRFTRDQSVASNPTSRAVSRMFNLVTRPPLGLANSICAQTIQRSSLHLTSLLESKKAGRHKTSINHDKPLTYEQANKPDMICVRKSFNSINTSGLFEDLRPAQTVQEELLLRKFVYGTWPNLLPSDIIIKRRANQIIVNLIVLRQIAPTKMYFLAGYTEEILSYILKCPVKLEIQTVSDASDLTYKYI